MAGIEPRGAVAEIEPASTATSANPKKARGARKGLGPVTSALIAAIAPHDDEIAWRLVHGLYRNWLLRFNDIFLLLFVVAPLLAEATNGIILMVALLLSAILGLGSWLYLIAFPRILRRRGMTELLFSAPLESAPFIRAIVRHYLLFWGLSLVVVVTSIIVLSILEGRPPREFLVVLTSVLTTAIAVGYLSLMSYAGKSIWAALPFAFIALYATGVYHADQLYDLLAPALPQRHRNDHTVFAIYNALFAGLCLLTGLRLHHHLKRWYLEIKRAQMYP